MDIVFSIFLLAGASLLYILRVSEVCLAKIYIALPFLSCELVNVKGWGG